MTALNRLIIERYIINLFTLIISVFFIYKIYKKIVQKEKILEKKYMQEIAIPFYIKNNKIIDTILMFLMLLWIYMTISFTKGCIIDFKNVLETSCTTTQCTIKSNATKNLLSENTITCEKDGNRITFTYIGADYPIGTIVDISYYKYLQVGQINEVIPNEQKNFGRIN